MRVAAVHKYGHFKLCRQRKLGSERLFLLFRRGKVTVEIEAAFANRHHFWSLRQPAQGFPAFRGPLAAVVRMHASGRPTAFVALRQLLCLLALVLRVRGVEAQAHERAQDARAHEDALPLGPLVHGKAPVLAAQRHVAAKEREAVPDGQKHEDREHHHDGEA